MAEVTISLSPHERGGLLASTVSCLVRSRAFGEPGDGFKVDDTWFVITSTEIVPWTRIRDEYFSECGFESPQAFQDRYWIDIAKKRNYDPSISKVVHWVGRVRLSDPPKMVPGWPFWVIESKMFKRPLVWNDQERLGMDALAYCMGIQCPLKDRCKRDIREAANYPHEGQVKLLPTTPYNKLKGDCDYFIKK